MKIRPVGGELFHANGRTDRLADMTKLIVAFRSIANPPNELYCVFNYKLNVQNKTTFTADSRARAMISSIFKISIWYWMTDCSIHTKKKLALLLTAPLTKCCGELSWNLNARKCGYPLYWKRKTRLNVVLCSCLSLLHSANFFGVILPYRESTCQTNYPLICIESSNECETVEVSGQQNP
jgi:hypothetical protein